MGIEREYLDQSCAIDLFSASGDSTKNEFLFLAAVPAKMHNLRAVHHQQALNVSGPNR
jgi:hypothetical protein